MNRLKASLRRDSCASSTVPVTVIHHDDGFAHLSFKALRRSPTPARHHDASASKALPRTATYSAR